MTRIAKLTGKLMVFVLPGQRPEPAGSAGLNEPQAAGESFRRQAHSVSPGPGGPGLAFCDLEKW
jgi:hypothetical protein